MNKYWRLSYFVIGIFFFHGCDLNYPLKRDFKEVKGNLVSCDKLIDSLLKTSSYVNPIEGKDVFYDIDNISDSIIRVHVLHKNQEEKDVTCGWLEINLVYSEIKDVTINPDSPVLISNFNANLIRQIKQKCSH
jgi:hypothetical protein